jgi:hypothetical protein
MTDEHLHDELLREPLEPPRDFRDRLRERLRAQDASARRPPHMWVIVAAYAGSGAALLVIAAIAGL